MERSLSYYILNYEDCAAAIEAAQNINRESMISGKSQQPAHPADVWQQIQKYPLTPELVF